MITFCKDEDTENEQVYQNKKNTSIIKYSELQLKKQLGSGAYG